MNELKLDDLLTEPRDVNADRIVTRVRRVMDSRARECCPDRNPVVRPPAGDWKPEEKDLVVPWWPVFPAGRAFLKTLAWWQRTGSTASAEAVIQSSVEFVEAWCQTVTTTVHIDDMYMFGEIGWTDRAAMIAAVREFVLKGLVVDTGKLRQGEIVWSVSDHHSRFSTWDE
jgi:hypothetical protein